MAIIPVVRQVDTSSGIYIEDSELQRFLEAVDKANPVQRIAMVREKGEAIIKGYKDVTLGEVTHWLIHQWFEMHAVKL